MTELRGGASMRRRVRALLGRWHEIGSASSARRSHPAGRSVGVPFLGARAAARGEARRRIRRRRVAARCRGRLAGAAGGIGERPPDATRGRRVSRFVGPLSLAFHDAHGTFSTCPTHRRSRRLP